MFYAVADLVVHGTCDALFGVSDSDGVHAVGPSLVGVILFDLVFGYFDFRDFDDAFGALAFCVCEVVLRDDITDNTASRFKEFHIELLAAVEIPVFLVLDMEAVVTTDEALGQAVKAEGP